MEIARYPGNKVTTGKTRSAISSRPKEEKIRNGHRPGFIALCGICVRVCGVEVWG